MKKIEKKNLININVESFSLLPTPDEIRKALPASPRAISTVFEARRIIRNILDEKDKRLFIVVGPCSIHDTKAALEYAQKLKVLSEKVCDKMLLVMRVYFEKPRTTVGWKGLINDPFMDDSFHIDKGLKIARKLLIELNDMGVPAATEALDPIVPQYISELMCWTAIGARTTESQTHRELASGLSTPVGFKNGTDGNIEVAINALQSSLAPHHFLGVEAKGRISVFRTKGNPYLHIVLRGGNKGPNFDVENVKRCEKALLAKGLPTKIMIDCSHGNSNKDPRKQPEVFDAVVKQIKAGDRSIVALMVESHLYEGGQEICNDLKKLKYGVSVTDKCLGWEDTEAMILKAYENL